MCAVYKSKKSPLLSDHSSFLYAFLIYSLSVVLPEARERKCMERERSERERERNPFPLIFLSSSSSLPASYIIVFVVVIVLIVVIMNLIAVVVVVSSSLSVVLPHFGSAFVLLLCRACVVGREEK